MNLTVDISEDDLREIQRHSGEQKKGPAIQKFIADKLKLAHRLEISRKFLTGEWERRSAFDRKTSQRSCPVSYVIDSSIWVHFFRAASPAALKHQAAKLIEDERAMLCEPVLFELLRATPAAARRNVQSQLDLFPLAPTPRGLWHDAAQLGQKCLGRGFVPAAMDLLIAQVCLDQNLELITFAQNFAGIAGVSSLRVRVLDRASK